ncbi:MAG: hypothetical protein KatS3mg034_1994 [Vicingaceae bacterium]|nr:MAG: hypothetical protein KatS3mg034_1994 [Vicingaceae bacterium]
MKKLYLLICFVISTTLLADSKKNSKTNYLEQIKFIKNNNLIKNNSNIKAFYLFRSYSREIIITNKGLIFHYFNWKKNRYDRIDLEFINAEINEENFINAGKTIPISYYMSNKNVETFSTEMLVVKNIYPNIDWKLYFDEEGNFKYDFVVYPGGDAGKICWRYKFANTKLNDNEILVKSMEASHYENIPLAYLNNNNEHINVEYIQNKNHYFTFKIDRSYEKDTLIIDPVVVWATNYGGSNTDIVTDLEFDGTYLWVTGYTASANFPTLNPGSGSYYQGSLSGSNDIFLLQFDNMQNLVWATFLGGTGNDQANALSQQGNYIFLTGSTTSTNTFPTVNPGGSAYFAGTNGGSTDAFVCRFNKTTRQLEWNTFYGGNNNDIAYDVFYDNYNIYVCGRTWSGNLTTVDPGGGAYFQGTKDDQSDGFILKFGNNLGLKWATYYGKGTSSNNEDYLYKIFSDTSHSMDCRSCHLSKLDFG